MSIDHNTKEEYEIIENWIVEQIEKTKERLIDVYENHVKLYDIIYFIAKTHEDGNFDVDSIEKVFAQLISNLLEILKKYRLDLCKMYRCRKIDYADQYD
jgi:regulator of sigma D